MQLMYFFHFGRAGGHQGITRTYNRLSRHFWWGSMKDDIQKYNAQCLTCMRRRPHARRLLEGSLLADRPGVIVALDIVGPVEHNQRRYYLLTMIDHFTKFAEVVVLSETSSLTVWQMFFVRWLTVWGCPTYLLSDNGPQFGSKEFQRRCREFGIEKIYSMPYHPQGNGMVESFHQFLVRSVAAYVGQTSWNLVDIVASVLLAYRSTPHPMTGESPYRLMTGMDFVLPHFQQWADYSFEHMDTYRRFNLLAQVRKDCLDHALRRAAKHQPTSQNKLNCMTKVGDLVVCWLNPNEVSKLLSRFGNLKFAPRWSEPCRVMKFLDADKNSMLVKSIWHKGILRKVHMSDVRRLPTQLVPETLNAAKFELIADLKRNAITENITPTHLKEILQRIPAEDREMAKDRVATLEEAWKAPKEAEMSMKNRTKIDNADELIVHETIVRNVPQSGKKRRVELHAMWTGADGVVALKGGEVEVSKA